MTIELNSTNEVTQLPMEPLSAWANVKIGLIATATIARMLGQVVETNSQRKMVPRKMPTICISRAVKSAGAGNLGCAGVHRIIHHEPLQITLSIIATIIVVTAFTIIIVIKNLFLFVINFFKLI